MKYYFLKILKSIVLSNDLLGHMIHFYFNKSLYRKTKFRIGTDMHNIQEENVAVYHVYTNSLTTDRINYINMLTRNKFHVLICSSVHLCNISLDQFTNPNQITIFERPNVGRDICTYKIFSFLLRDKNILFTNDSLIFFQAFLNLLNQRSKR